MTSKEDILRLTNNGLDIFRHYVPGDWEAGTQFRNPFYRDTKASFYIYYNLPPCIIHSYILIK